MKAVEFVGSSYEDLVAMPAPVVDTFGYAIHLAQTGGKHEAAKPLRGYGAEGVFEIVDDWDGDTFRALYAVKIGELVYVLHCFQKKSPRGSQMPRPDVETLVARLKAAKQHARDRRGKMHRTSDD